MMQCIEVFFIFIYCFTSFKSQTVSTSTGCMEPIEEGHSFYIRFSPYIQYTYIAFHVDRGDGYEEITRCYTSGPCVNGGGLNYIQFLTYVSTTHLYSTTLEILSMNRDMLNWTAVWNDVYGGVHVTQPCNISTYVRPQLPDCDQPVFTSSNTAVSLTCHTQRVFPPAKCILSSNLETNPTVNYTFESLVGNTGDVIMHYTLQFRLQPIVQQNLNSIISVTMVQFDSIQTQLRSISLELSLPSAELGNDCPIYVNLTSKCACTLTKPGSPPGNAFWNSTDSTLPMAVDSPDGSSQLKLIGRLSDLQSEVEYYCSSKSAIGQQKDSYKYKPQYLFKPQSAACDQPVFINSSTAVSVTCHAENVYPTAQCQLINYSQLEMSPYVIYNYILPTGEPGHVNMWCTFQWALKYTQLSNATIVMAVKMLQLRMFETQLNNISLNLYLPNVELKSDCFKYLSTTCTCALTSAGSPPAKAAWSSSKSVTLSTVDRRDGSSQLTLPPRQPDFKYEEYYCTAVSPIGQHSEPVIYEPKYFSGPSQIYIEANAVVEMSTTIIQVYCHVPKIDTFPGISIDVNVGVKQYHSLSIDDDGDFYNANFTFASETLGSLLISCTARNIQEPTVEIINKTTINISVIPGDVQVILMQSNSSCHPNAINITCSVMGKNLHSGLVAVLYVDSEIMDSLPITERSFSYTMVYRNESSGHGALEISCVVRNIFGYHVVPPRKIIVKNENPCSESTSENHTTEIVVGVIVPIVSVAFLFCFIVACCRHKCRGIPYLEAAKLNGFNRSKLSNTSQKGQQMNSDKTNKHQLNEKPLKQTSPEKLHEPKNLDNVNVEQSDVQPPKLNGSNQTNMSNTLQEGEQMIIDKTHEHQLNEPHLKQTLPDEIYEPINVEQSDEETLNVTVLNPSRPSPHAAYGQVEFLEKQLNEELSELNVINPSRISQAGPYEKMKCMGQQLKESLILEFPRLSLAEQVDEGIHTVYRQGAIESQDNIDEYET